MDEPGEEALREASVEERAHGTVSERPFAHLVAMAKVEPSAMAGHGKWAMQNIYTDFER